VNPLALSLAYLRDRWPAAIVNILLLALGVATLVILLVFARQLEDRFTRDAQGIDLVVGAKGSPLQLILSSIYHVDVPTGNIPVETAALLRRDRTIAEVIPLALGDNFRGFRIVGTEPALAAHYRAGLAEGRMFAAEGEAVVGAEVARRTGMGLGQKFTGSHGLTADDPAAHEHDHAVMTAVGILKPTGTVIDRLILTPVETVWHAHGIAHEHGDGHDHDHGGKQTAAVGAAAGGPAAAAAHGHGHDHAHDHGKAGAAHGHDHDHNHGKAAAAAHGRHGGHDHDHAHDHGAAKPAAVTTTAAEPAAPMPAAAVAAAAAPGATAAAPTGMAAAVIGERGELRPEHTALLVRYASPLAAVRLPAFINQQTNLQAASPAVEITRLLSLLGVGLDALRAFALLLMGAAALSIFVALYNALSAREGDMALLRVMGARPGAIFGQILTEGLLLAAMGAALGLFLAHGVLALASGAFPQLADLGLKPWAIDPREWWVVAGALALGALAAALPALRVFRQDLATTLARAA
jgi:putative ABC transport system permease protein